MLDCLDSIRDKISFTVHNSGVLDEAVAKTVSDEFINIVKAWYETAIFYHKNEEYYRGLIVKIGEMLGPDAYTDDAGKIHDSVLCAKVPELVENFLPKQASKNPMQVHPEIMRLHRQQQVVGGF